MRDPEEVLNEIFNLFIDLEASDEQCDFPYLFAIAREGKALTNSKTGKSRRALSRFLKGFFRLCPRPKLILTASFKC